MLGTEIVKQGQLFLEAALYGALLMLLYDCLRIVRRVFRHGVAGMAVEDLLFWLFWAFGMFGFMYRQNDGVIRGFLICGAAVGMICYGVFASRYVVRTGTVMLRGVLRILRRVLLVVTAPFRRLGRFLHKKTGRCRQCLAHLLQKQTPKRCEISRSKSFHQAHLLQKRTPKQSEISRSKSFHQAHLLQKKTPKQSKISRFKSFHQAHLLQKKTLKQSEISQPESFRHSSFSYGKTIDHDEFSHMESFHQSSFLRKGKGGQRGMTEKNFEKISKS